MSAVPFLPLDRRLAERVGAVHRFLAGEGYGIDVDAVRRRYPEVSWTSFADWAGSGR